MKFHPVNANRRHHTKVNVNIRWFCLGAKDIDDGGRIHCIVKGLISQIIIAGEIFNIRCQIYFSIKIAAQVGF